MSDPVYLIDASLIDAKLSNILSLLHELKDKPIDGPPYPDPEEFLTVQEAAKFLKLSVPTVYTIIHQKRISVMKSSKRCYFSKLDLVNYLKSGRKKSTEEISAAADDYINEKKG